MPQRRTLGRTLRRAAAMSPGEAATRLVHYLRQRQDGLRNACGLPPPSERELPAPPPAQFFFSAEDIPEIAAELKRRLPGQAARILSQAEKIARRRFDLLGYEDLDFGQQIDWHLDAASGRRAPKRAWYRVPYLDYAIVGDHKVTWELNRHQHLVTLAKAWWLDHDDRHLETLTAQWNAWREANPYGVGINWASSLEVAFRALSWLWVLRLLPSPGPLPKTFRSQLVTELGRSARHIERYLSTYFAPNTHLLGEAVALHFVGTLCPQFVSSRRWRELGWRILLEQAEKQVRPDGLHFEQSTYYHVYALDFFLHARLLATRNQSPGESPLDPTIERMAGALQTLAQAGVPPRFGDDDGGRLFDGSRNRTAHLTDPLATCAALYSRPDFKAASPQLPEETLWLLGVSGAQTYDQVTAAAPRPQTRLFEQSGLACIASAGPPRQALLVDAGPHGFGNSGHGHADALSVQLIVEGHAALTDPGTYCYPVELAERDAFRGTAAHSTLVVDGLDQAEPAGSFAWRHLPRVRLESWVEAQGGALLVATHNGYERLDQPVTHRRWVASLGRGLYLIRDVATGEGTHDLRLYWRLGPEFRAASGGEQGGPAKPVSARFLGPNGIVLDLLPAESPDRNSEIPPGAAKGPWSAAYGQQSTAPVWSRGKKAGLPAEFATVIQVSNAETPPARFEAVAVDTGKLSVYRYRDAERCVVVLFRDLERPWSWNKWASDATFLAIETDQAGSSGRRVFLSGGSFLESASGHVLSCRHKVQCWEWLRGSVGDQVFCSDPEAVETLTLEALVFSLL